MGTQTKLIPVPKWQEHHPWPTIGGWRKLLFNRNSNGIHKVVRCIGRRVLIDEAAFFQWVEEQQSNLPQTKSRKR